MANISDVAKLAKVSVATVSRYLNQKGYVGQKSRESIETAIRELNYLPSEVARTLSTKQSDLIGLIIPDIKNPFFPELARAVEDTAFKYGYTVILCNTDENSKKEQHYLKTLTQKYVAGLILTTSIEKVNYDMKIEVPVVALDRSLDDEIPAVTTNNKQGAKVGTDYLIHCGATKLLCLQGPKHIASTEERVLGFLEAIAGKDIEANIIDCPFDFEVAETIVFEYLQENPSINGIFACSDASAIGALKAVYQLQKQIPAEIQIVGFDGIEIGNVVTPSLTTVAQQIYKLGETATELLIQQIEGIKLENPHVSIDPKLIVRETTRKEQKR